MHHTKHFASSTNRCIELCNQCRDECETVFFQHCVKEGGKHVEENHAKLMADCIEACETAAHFMLRGSEHHMLLCHACAEICEACANSCLAFDTEDMQNCAETCRKCAESCREMASGLPASLIGKIQQNATQANLM